MGLRPRGSNPFAKINRAGSLPPKPTTVVASWYQRLNDYPKTILHDALLSMLFSGLRVNEIVTAHAADFVYDPKGVSSIRVVGKGNKPRTVYLFYRQAWSIDRWVQYRTYSANPWLFPTLKKHCTRSSQYRPGPQHIHAQAITHLVQRLCRQVFASEDEAWIRGKITPHKFRHFFVSDCLARGMKPSVVQAQVGHASQSLLNRYTGVDPAWIEQEIRAIDHGQILSRPLSGAARLLSNKFADKDPRRDLPAWDDALPRPKKPRPEKLKEPRGHGLDLIKSSLNYSDLEIYREDEGDQT
jgi:integrase